LESLVESVMQNQDKKGENPWENNTSWTATGDVVETGDICIKEEVYPSDASWSPNL
jgi:hypothetical protein